VFARSGTHSGTIVRFNSELKTTHSQEVQKTTGKLKQLFTPFVTGGKQLFRDYRRTRQIKIDLIDNLNELSSREELRLVRKTEAEIKKALPILVAFWIPVVGYTVPFVCAAFPTILPDALKSEAQKTKEMNNLMARRRDISAQVLQRVREGLEFEPYFVDFAAKLTPASKNQVNFLENFESQEDRESLAQAFQTPTDELSNRALTSLNSFFNHRSLLSPIAESDEFLRKYLELLRVDNFKLQRLGDLNQLSDVELSEALFERGADPTKYSREESVDFLGRWIDFHHEDLHDSFILHSIVLRNLE